MRRREFMIGGVALATGPGAFPRWAAAEPAPARVDRIIDAHCHIFNADDLPIEGFVKKVILPQTARSNQLVARFQEYPGALRALVHALAIQVKRGAPGKQAEIDKIAEIERDPRKKLTPAWRRAEDLRNVEATLHIIWGGDSTMFRGIGLRDGVALEVALENLQLFLVQLFHPQFGKPALTADEREQLRNWPLGRLAARLYERDDLVGRYIRWALLFTRYRFELAEELDLLHGRSAQKPRIALMTPAMVDFGKWLEDDNHERIEDQVEVMTAIARRRGGPRVHGFVAFDPLRQALYDRGRRKPGDKDPIRIVRAAIEVNAAGAGAGRTTGGSIGVKLYPPMGFQAMGNASLLDDGGFADPVYLRSTEIGLVPQIGAKLDAALSKLYAWCSQNNVPVMAHTNDSFGPNPDYEKRAHPKFWASVLEPAAFPQLRINMAHFGHFSEAVPYEKPGEHLKECWEWRIGEIFSALPDSYAYADVSSLSELLKVGPSRKILECMRAFREAFPSAADHLIYGTDWSMIAQSEGFPKINAAKPFPDMMVTFLLAAGYDGAQVEAIMFRNATRFLGLSASERIKHGDNCTRGRLEKFYAAHRLSAEWMKAFD